MNIRILELGKISYSQVMHNLISKINKLYSLSNAGYLSIHISMYIFYND